MNSTIKSKVSGLCKPSAIESYDLDNSEVKSEKLNQSSPPKSEIFQIRKIDG